MKKFYWLISSLLVLLWIKPQAQPNFYSTSVNQTQINLRGNPVILAQIDLVFPTDGYVVVHFNGECYASVGDRIVLAASNNGDWGTNDGNILIETSKPGFARPFSHTRLYSVSAGAHSYYAVGENYVELDGSGLATLHGTLSVEYFPDTGNALVKANGFVFNGDVTNTTVVAEQTIHVNAPGKIMVRFDGLVTSSPGDRIVLAASNNMSWSFNDGNVAVEAVNAGDVDENSFSHTRLYSVNAAGDYTYYAVAQNWGKTAGDGMIWVYGNLLTEFFPTTGPEKIQLRGFTLPLFDLNGESVRFDSISLNAEEPGKVMVELDGYFTADPGYDIVLAASENGEWTENDGNVTLQALDLDQNRYSFSHTRIYNIGSGNHMLYAVGQIFGGSGSKTADLFGELTVKYLPFSATPVADITQEPKEIEVFPNPARDWIRINLSGSATQAGTIRLLELNGQLLREFPHSSAGEINIDLSAYPSGLYWIQAGKQVKAVVKM